MEEEEDKGMTGVVPNEEIKGSDADKAYDENGNFGKRKSQEQEPAKSNVPPGADADADV